MVWQNVTVAFDHPFVVALGPAGPLGKALGTAALGSVSFDLKLEIETDQECRIRKYTPVPLATASAGVHLTGPPTVTVYKDAEDKPGCLDSAGKKDSWDVVEASAYWSAEGSALSLPIWTPFGTTTIGLPTTQMQVQLSLTVWPNGAGKPTRRQRAWVDGVLQFDHR